MSLKFVIPIIVLFFLVSTTVFASSKSDFDFQYSKYRQSYSEFLLFKKDYLDTSSLDNQQKAILSAKETINVRDLTKAAFTSYVRDLITNNNLNYPPLVSIADNLLESQQFFMNEAVKSQSIITLANLNDFNDNYLNAYIKHEQSIRVGIVAQKIAKLKYFSVQQEKSLASLKSKIQTVTVSQRVSERITELSQNLSQVSEKIDLLLNDLTSEENLATEGDIFFSSKVDQLSEIRALQMSWMDKLIDLDLNYGEI